MGSDSKLKNEKLTSRIITVATIRYDQTTKQDTPLSIFPSSVSTNLRTTQKPNQAPAITKKTTRNTASCNSELACQHKFLQDM